MTVTKKTRASGAGVKSEDQAKPLERKQIQIDPQSSALLMAVGGGNLSLGIREAARRLVEHKDLTPFSVERHMSRPTGGAILKK